MFPRSRIAQLQGTSMQKNGPDVCLPARFVDWQGNGTVERLAERLAVHFLLLRVVVHLVKSGLSCQGRHVAGRGFDFKLIAFLAR